MWTVLQLIHATGAALCALKDASFSFLRDLFRLDSRILQSLSQARSLHLGTISDWSVAESVYHTDLGLQGHIDSVAQRKATC